MLGKKRMRSAFITAMLSFGFVAFVAVAFLNVEALAEYGARPPAVEVVGAMDPAARIAASPLWEMD